eukprot:5935629-Amphidinium_carterae.1
MLMRSKQLGSLQRRVDSPHIASDVKGIDGRMPGFCEVAEINVEPRNHTGCSAELQVADWPVCRAVCRLWPTGLHSKPGFTHHLYAVFAYAHGSGLHGVHRDGLKEDVNKVKGPKPFVELKEADGREDTRASPAHS